MSRRIYSEEHSILELEFLDRGYEIRDRLELLDLSEEELDKQLGRRLEYVHARIPEEFWEPSTGRRVSSRETWKELRTYFENARTARRHGLGLTLIGSGVGYRTQSLYVVCKELVDRGFSCFVVSYPELVYFLKEAWHNDILDRELGERFRSDFLALVEIPHNSDDIIAAVKQDFLARFQMRLSKGLPIIFSIDTKASSLNAISSDSFAGRLLLPFVRVNRPIRVEDIGDADTMYMDRWSLLNGEN